MKTIITLVFAVFSHFAFGQLIDPFGKVITHEIKLKKLDNGMYAGAMEWTTGGVDSLQRFIVKGLDVKSPVMVRIVSKAPDHNIDLSFHKKNWDKVESKISTDGNKFADKIFRTMSIAGLGVSSEVAGIPYLIIIKVGLQFPSTKSLIRLTDDKEEYAMHLRKMGFTGAIFEDHDSSGGSNRATRSNETSGEGRNTLTYTIIGLLTIIIILLILFLFKRNKSKNTALLVFLFCSIQIITAQNSEPKLVPVSGQGDSPVFYEYQNENVSNQVPVPDVAQSPAKGPDKSGRIYTPVRIELGAGVKELTGYEADDIQTEMREADQQFNDDYGADSPGEPTAGDQRNLPSDRTTEELDALRREVQQLQRQVDLLSQEDEAFDDDTDAGGGALIYCEDVDVCQNCVESKIAKFNTHLAYWNYLQKFYLKEVDDLNDKIEYGNTLASIPDYGLAWGPILMGVVRPAMKKLKDAYNKKFDEYILSIEADLQALSACYEGPDGGFSTNESFEIQAYAIINSLKAARINK